MPQHWTPEEYWEYVGGLAGDFERDQMRTMLSERGLVVGSAQGTETYDFCKRGKKWSVYPKSAVNDGIDWFIAEADSKADAQKIADALNTAHRSPASVLDRKTFVVPDGFEAVRDAEGRATGDIKPVACLTPAETELMLKNCHNEINLLRDELFQARAQVESARGYVERAIASYAGDPADNQFQKGFLAALEVVRDEAFGGGPHG